MTEKSDVRRGYDELAGEYAARQSTDERELAILDEFVGGLSQPVRLLDAGCGHGAPVLRRLNEVAPAVGLDISHAQLTLAAETVPRASLVHGDMVHLPFRSDTFDAVTAYDSLIHVPLSEHLTVLEEFARVLRPEGRVLLSEAPEALERVNPNWLDSDVTMTWSMAGAEATREHLRAAGFRLTNEWSAPERSETETPRPPFFAASLDS